MTPGLAEPGRGRGRGGGGKSSRRALAGAWRGAAAACCGSSVCLLAGLEQDRR